MAPPAPLARILLASVQLASLLCAGSSPLAGPMSLDAAQAQAPCCEGMDPRADIPSLFAPRCHPLFVSGPPLALRRGLLCSAAPRGGVPCALGASLAGARRGGLRRQAIGGVAMASGGGGAAELAGIVQRSVQGGTFVKGSLLEYQGEDKEIKAVYLRMVQLKRGVFVQALMRYKTNDQTKNHPTEEAGELVRSLLEGGFTKASIFTTEGDYQLTTKKGSMHVSKVPGAPAFSEAEIQGHDRKKKVPVEASSDFLRALGVSNAQGKPKPGMADKLRQIQKFVSIVDHLVEGAGLAEGGEHRREGVPLRLVDMGCGKGYLTFAAHAHLSQTKGVCVLTEGVEMRGDLVAKTNDIARELALAPGGADGGGGLRFVQGYISEHAQRVEEEGVDVLVALHACDTATDDALFCGVRAGARVIITSPCCHKEFRRQMEGGGGQKKGVLQDMFRHGILREREAESVTDTVRALLLELAGYDASVFEFIGGEHTAKNTMITAVKADKAQDPTRLRGRLAELMAFYGLREQRLAALMGELPGAPSGGSKRPLKGKRAPVVGGSVLDVGSL